MTRFCLMLLCLWLPMRAAALGFDYLPEAGGGRLALGIWYPSEVAPPPALNTPFGQAVAMGAPIAGEDLPLIVLSHGNASWMGSHAATAAYLAEAGFVVAAIQHRDDSAMTPQADPARWMLSRPQEITETIDFITHDWARAEAVAEQVGVFGFSAGAYSVLTAAGVRLDSAQLWAQCDAVPQEFLCRIGLLDGVDPAALAAGLAALIPDARIAAVSAAAPAFGYAVSGAGALGERPVQLWWAERDDRVPEATNAPALRRALPKAHHERLADVGHFAFIGPCDPGLEQAAPEVWQMLCRDDPTARAAAFEQFNAGLLAFFDATLR